MGTIIKQNTNETQQNQSSLKFCWPIYDADYAQWNIILLFFIVAKKWDITAGSI